MELSGFYWVLLVAYFFSFSHALICYECTNQDANSGNCLINFKTCKQGQDTCFTEIKWRSTPDSSRSAKKHYYVSKQCSTKEECERIKQDNKKHCTFIRSEDWKCSECCQGDTCNDYAIF